MTANKADSEKSWVDPDDAPELTEAFFTHAELSVDGTVIRPARDTLRRAGRPKADTVKTQITLRLDPDVIAHFREDGPGWQGRMNAALRQAAGLKR